MTTKQNWRRLGVSAAVGVWSLLLAGSAWSQAPPDLPQPLPEPPKAQAPKVDPPKVDPPKVDTPKVDVPKKVDDVKGPVKDARDAARDVPRDARDAVRDVPRDARDAVRDVPRDARDAVRDTRDAVRDVPRDARDAVRDTRDAVRDVPGDTVRGTRDAIRGTGANIRLDNLRAADLGLTFAPARNGWLSVSALAPTTALGRIGLRTGDYIMSVNGQRLAAEADFVRFLLADDVRASARVPMVVWRDGRQVTLYVEPALLVENLQPAQRAGGFAQFGVAIDDRYPDQVVVLRVTSGSPAHSAGIRAGDLLTSIDGQRIGGIADFEAAIEASGRSTVRVEFIRQVDVNLARSASAVPHTTFRPSVDGAVMPAQPTYTQPVPVYRDDSYRAYNRNSRRGRR